MLIGAADMTQVFAPNSIAAVPITLSPAADVLAIYPTLDRDPIQSDWTMISSCHHRARDKQSPAALRRAVATQTNIPHVNFTDKRAHFSHG
jgi:hypothetical protein